MFRVVHSKATAHKRTVVQMGTGRLSLLSVHKLNQSCISLAMKDLDSNNVSVNSKQSEKHVGSCSFGVDAARDQNRSATHPTTHRAAHKRFHASVAIRRVRVVIHHRHAAWVARAVGGRGCRKVGVGEIPALLIVVLDLQVLQRGELDSKCAAPTVDVLSIKLELRLDGGSDVKELDQGLEPSGFVENNDLQNGSILRKDPMKDVDIHRVKNVEHGHEKDVVLLFLLLSRWLKSRDFVTIGVLEVDGLASNVGADVAVVLKQCRSALNILHLDQRLILSLQHQDIRDWSERTSQRYDVLLSGILGKTTAMEGL